MQTLKRVVGGDDTAVLTAMSARRRVRRHLPDVNGPLVGLPRGQIGQIALANLAQKPNTLGNAMLPGKLFEPHPILPLASDQIDHVGASAIGELRHSFDDAVMPLVTVTSIQSRNGQQYLAGAQIITRTRAQSIARFESWRHSVGQDETVVTAVTLHRVPGPGVSADAEDQI